MGVTGYAGAVFNGLALILFEEVVSRFVAIKLPCRPLWRAAKGTVRQYSLISSGGMARQCLSNRRTSTRTCCEFYLDRAGTLMGRLFAMALACLSF